MNAFKALFTGLINGFFNRSEGGEKESLAVGQTPAYMDEFVREINTHCKNTLYVYIKSEKSPPITTGIASIHVCNAATACVFNKLGKLLTTYGDIAYLARVITAFLEPFVIRYPTDINELKAFVWVFGAPVPKTHLIENIVVIYSPSTEGEYVIESQIASDILMRISSKIEALTKNPTLISIIKRDESGTLTAGNVVSDFNLRHEIIYNVLRETFE